MLLIMISVFVGLSLQAQNNKELRREKFKMKMYERKLDFIKEQVSFTAEEEKAFFPVYNEYSLKKHEIRKKLREARREMNKSGVMNYELINDLEVETEQEDANLQAVYYQKFKKIISAQKIYEVKQAERNFKKKLVDKVANKKLP